MKIQTVKLVYFSPTGTTESVIKGIRDGINIENIEYIDITQPEARKKTLHTSSDELLVIGVPVYMGRVPALLNDWLNTIKAKNTPAVCVVVYGNRVYDDALLELKNIATSRGCVPIACAAYIGEHSFSDSEIPTAQGRPDEKDLIHAKTFGQLINDKIQAISSISKVSDIDVPGTYPYGGITKLWDVDFIEVNDLCVQCGICSQICPVGAVDPQESKVVNVTKCITCCACIKKCPENARIIKEGPVKDAQKRLNNLFSAPKKPEYFL